MAIAPQRLGIGIRRHFTSPEVHPYDEVTWERRDARITNYRDGAVAFEQLDVEVPSTWSLNATNILSQKYFRGTPGTAERETSLKQVADRVVDTITTWGVKDGYFVDDEEAETFRAELKHLVIHQKAAFNSPVWLGLLHPVGRRLDGLDPQLVHRGGRHLQGRLGRRGEPVAHPLLPRAPEGRRHRLGPGQLHAGRRLVGRYHQVRR
jgi:hypothetical protein